MDRMDGAYRGLLNPANDAQFFASYRLFISNFAQIAEEEGFKKVAAQFRAIAVAEKRHEERFLKLAKNIEDGVVFKSGNKVRWICRKCGYVPEAEAAPKMCAACGHPQAYFELDALNY